MDDLKTYLALKTQKERWIKVISDAMCRHFRSRKQDRGAMKTHAFQDAGMKTNELTTQLKQIGQMEEAR